MYIIKELDIKVPFGSLLLDILNERLWFNAETDKLIIFEREKAEIVNKPSLEGYVEEVDNQFKVVFRTPIHDATYPYPGNSKKLVKFLKFLQKKYGGKLKIKRGN